MNYTSGKNMWEFPMDEDTKFIAEVQSDLIDIRKWKKKKTDSRFFRTQYGCTFSARKIWDVIEGFKTAIHFGGFVAIELFRSTTNRKVVELWGVIDEELVVEITQGRQDDEDNWLGNDAEKAFWIPSRAVPQLVAILATYSLSQCLEHQTDTDE